MQSNFRSSGDNFLADVCVTFTHPFVGHTDDSSITADHEDNQAKQGDVPSAKNKQKKASKSMWTLTFTR